MSGHNPYAPSKASLKLGSGPVSGDGIWRDDDRVIVAHGAAFPHRCVKCNEPSVEPHKMRKVYWHHPGLYLLFLLYVFIYIVVALIVRKKAEIDPGLCAEHLRKRRTWIAIGWFGSIGSIFVWPAIGAALELEPPVSMGLAFLTFLTIIVVSMVKSRILYPKRIDDRFARLRGADERFLASLPEFLTY